MLVLNGPNLNLLGGRQPQVYGHDTLDDVASRCRTLGAELGLTVRFAQSNHEGELIELIHQAHAAGAALLINPAGYGHTSVALRDAVTMLAGPKVEVHISNVHAREEFRHHSYLSAVVDAVIIGAGVHGYELGIRHIASVRNR
ncbi:MAG: type II 3-dehydroquinate dehydratase [Micrococcales bacterium]|nr:MAG: type II 3-dehydroquinate dehydratase [Micrococcales bacterium]PIE26794.1 MAG: type II 3-dehydroquinate dehydratase [Micrococcales bacterium]